MSIEFLPIMFIVNDSFLLLNIGGFMIDSNLTRAIDQGQPCVIICKQLVHILQLQALGFREEDPDERNPDCI